MERYILKEQHELEINKKERDTAINWYVGLGYSVIVEDNSIFLFKETIVNNYKSYINRLLKYNFIYGTKKSYNFGVATITDFKLIKLKNKRKLEVV